MSITTSYNKQNNTYYAYETDYVFDEIKQRKVQKRRCIGKYDPETNKIIPTGKRGRPPKKWPENNTPAPVNGDKINRELIEELSKLSSHFQTIEYTMSKLSSELNSVKAEYDELIRRFSE